MPRHRKNETVLKLEGGFRKDRHENRDEKSITTLCTAIPECPASITDANVSQGWDMVLRPLVMTSRVGVEDLPVLESAFLAMQDVYAMITLSRSEIFKEPITKTSEEYSRVQAIINRRSQFFVKTMGRFGCTSQDRLSLLGAIAGTKKKQNLADKMTGGGA